MKDYLFFFALAFLAFGCIGDDVIFDEVPEAIRITTPLDTIGVGDSFQLEAISLIMLESKKKRQSFGRAPTRTSFLLIQRD